MGIRLDWDVETEKSGVYNAKEDPEMARLRRQRRRRILFTVIGLMIILGAVGGLFVWRLAETDNAIEALLRNTIDAEIAALRIGDWNAFRAAQRSADPAWEPYQRQVFDYYQTLKVERDLQLTGTVRSVIIDKLRARVVVEELIDGIPYAQVWFYWRYEDGWRHGPQDLAFWGDRLEYTGRDVTVRYYELDEDLARDLGVAVENWTTSTCGAILRCGDLPHLTLNIVNQPIGQPAWDAERPWTLNISSPYLTRVRYDQPFSGQLRVDVADAIARRLVDEASTIKESPIYPRDAYYLRPSVTSWLIGRFAQLNTNALLITSLAENYGASKVGDLLLALRPDSSVDVLTGVTGVASLDQANLDWRDFLAWRFRLESELYARASGSTETDLAEYLALYDPAAQQLAQERYRSQITPNGNAEVVIAQKEIAPDGVAQIRAVTRFKVGEGDIREENIVFRFSSGTWRRAS